MGKATLLVSLGMFGFTALAAGIRTASASRPELHQPAIQLRFSEAGAHVVVPSRADSPKVTIALTSLRRGTSEIPLLKPLTVLHDHSAEFHRGLGIVEWYAARDNSLEQGVDIERHLDGPSTSPLVLTLGLSGMSAEDSDDNEALVLTHRGRPMLRFDKLYVQDVTGRRVPSKMTGIGPAIQVTIDDSRAQYPLHVDPVIWAPSQVLSSTTEAGKFWFSQDVQVSGDDLIATSASLSDPIFAFQRLHGQWEPTEVVRLPGGSKWIGDVALGEGTIVVAGYRSDDMIVSAHIFRKQGWRWFQTQELHVPESYGGNRIAIHGDYLAIRNGGSVYVYASDSNGLWTLGSKLSPPTPTQGFGCALGAADNALFVSNCNTATVSIFGRTGPGTWIKQQELMNVGDISYGGSQFVSGNLAIIGSNHGELADVYVRNTTGWNPTKRFEESNYKDVEYGGRVAVSDELALVSALGTDDGSGTVLLYRNANNGWSREAVLTPPQTIPNQLFGNSLAIAGNSVVIGCPGCDNQGLVFVFDQKLADGTECREGEACASGFCVKGRCCESACDASCESCSLEGKAGQCELVPEGTEGSCGAFTCNGLQRDCPDHCNGSTGCASTYYCSTELNCLPALDLGTRCSYHAQCVTGFCVDGVCCNEPCDRACEACGSDGHCGASPKLSTGNPSCLPYVCNGKDSECPTTCSSPQDCATGNVCTQGICAEGLSAGKACTEDSACVTGHCTDGVCCVRDSCGAFRCGSDGACPETCASSEECASGLECLSSGECSMVTSTPEHDDAVTGCTCENRKTSGHPLLWLTTLVALAWLRYARTRKPDTSWSLFRKVTR